MTDEPKQLDENQELVEGLQEEAEKLQDLDPKDDAGEVKGGGLSHWASPEG